MKYVIASDIHGSAYWCGKLMNVLEQEQPDKLILLGDVLYHGPRNDLPREYAPKQVIPMLTQWADRILCVRGNCEAEVDQMVLPFPCMADYAIVAEGDTTIYLTHGHLWNPDKLPQLPKGSLFFYGHTHVKFDQEVDGIRCLNPGSVSIPKDGSHSCMILEDGKVTVRILED